MAHRSNHCRQRLIASAAPSIPLRVPAAASALALVLALSGAPAHAQGQPAAAQDSTGSTQTSANARSSAGTRASASTKAAADPPAKKKDQPQVLQEVVVTGLRQSLMSAEAIKRLAPQIVDSVTAEDIGALPDQSVAEALERIPGVEIERTDNNRDPARITDEGGNVFIRGLSWVKSELDGEEIFSANDGRDVSFEDISPDLLAGINVYKTPTADQIEGGIGGVVDMITRKPLDSRPNLTAFSADYDYGDMIKKGYPTVNGLYSTKWDTDIGRMGFLVSGTYAKEGNRTDSTQLGDYVAQTLPVAEAGLPAGSTVYVPNSMGWRRLDFTQNRQTLDGVFQWQSPNDEWLLTAHAFQTKDNQTNLEFAEGSYGEYINSSGTAPYPTPQASCTTGCPTADYTAVNSAGIVTAGTVWIEPQMDTRYEVDHHATDQFTMSLSFTPTDRLTFSNDVQFVKSHADMSSMTAYTDVGNLSGTDGYPLEPTAADPTQGTFLTFNTVGSNPTMVLSQTPYEMNNPADYWWNAAMDHIEDNDAHQWADRLDGTFKFQDNPWLTAFRFGARFTDERAITREGNWNWSLLSCDYCGDDGYENAVPIGFSPSWATEYQPFNDYMRGSVPAPGVAFFPSFDLVRGGPTAAYNSVLAAVEKEAGNGWGWTPETTDWSSYNPSTGDNASNGINDQAQHTYAAYIMQDFKHDNTPIGPMDGNVGVRVVRTVDAPANGVLSVNALQNAPTVASCEQTYTVAQCQFLANALQFAGAGGTTPLSFAENEYTNVLPSLNLRFLLTHDLQWRLAASKSMSRPTFSDMIPYRSVGNALQSGSPLPAAANASSGTAGNPELKPIESTNYDSSLEWYFAPAGDLTFDLFYKKITNYIFTGVDNQTFTRNGVTETFGVLENMNGGTGNVKGFELAYQQFYSFLPWIFKGLGLGGNLTFVSNSGGENSAINVFDSPEVGGAQNKDLPLEGMSRWSYNAQLMYQAYGFEGRLAWNWRERYLLTTSAANLNEPAWMDNYGQLDGELFYDVTDYLKVGLQATNLLQARTMIDVGGATMAPVYSWTDTDRTVSVAVRMQF